MKRIVFLVCIIFSSVLMFAQEEENIRVFKESNFDDLIDIYKEENLAKESEDGFRIQIVLSNTREEVNKAKTNFYKEFPDMKIYVVYDQPYYKLRVGDFKSRLEARKSLLEVSEIYPTAFIVNDKINVKD